MILILYVVAVVALMDQKLTTLLNEDILTNSDFNAITADLISTLNFPLTLHQDLSISSSLCFAWK